MDKSCRDKTTSTGAIAIGILWGPLLHGSTMTIAYELRRRGGGYGVAAICGGLAQERRSSSRCKVDAKKNKEILGRQDARRRRRKGRDFRKGEISGFKVPNSDAELTKGGHYGL